MEMLRAEADQKEKAGKKNIDNVIYCSSELDKIFILNRTSLWEKGSCVGLRKWLAGWLVGIAV